ncbi:hypothetical protein [Lederbergia lenta]|uniref:hypothetical protein n=1 Tax=Lederbergia lenta TaxID=1467 RepID=UPI0020415374|nr:hypothetical protein [Lederbergia lenta]MCM3109907.1 hypothetical protein [Lederbergia lenta]
MARIYNSFEFTGTLGLPREERFHQINESASGWEGHRLNFAVQESKNNGVFVELFGGFNKAKANKVFSFSKGTESTKGAAMEIDWDDRLKDETVQMVADFKKIVIDFTTDPDIKKEIYNLRGDIRKLEYMDELTEEDQNKLSELYSKLKEVATDRYEFISEYDAVIFLANSLNEYKSNKFRVRGNIDYNYHKGNTYRKFKPTHIEIVNSEEVSKLRATIDLFFAKGAVDDKDFNKDKIVHIDTYAIGYDNVSKKDQFFPQPVIINASKLDLNNELHTSRLEFLKKQFEVKGKKVNHLVWEVAVFRGADVVEFTEKDLTPQQKQMVELGLNKLDDFKPKGGILGESVEENRLIKPLYLEFDKYNDFREGSLESEYEVDDLSYVVTEPKEKTKEKYDEVEIEEEVKVELDDMEALFS